MMRIGPSRDACRSLWLLALCLTGLGVVSTQAQTLIDHISPVEITECGQVVVTDAVLVQDLLCDTGEDGESAIELRASNITLDLGGRVIFGCRDGIGLGAWDVEGVTIRNGTIDGFGNGICLFRTHDVTVEDVTIRNLEADDPDDYFNGVRLFNSHDVLVRDSFIEFLPVAHKTAINLGNSEVAVDNAEVHGGGVGVDYGGVEDIPGGSSGSVINSRFVGVTIAAVLVQWTGSARVADNEFTRNDVSVSAEADHSGYVTGLTVEGNSIYDGYIGVQFFGATESSILNNVIRDSAGGISLRANNACRKGEPEPKCSYSSGNVIVGNEVLGNVLDLYHHEKSVGNTWERNTCQTKEGAEIPPCPRLRRRLQLAQP